MTGAHRCREFWVVVLPGPATAGKAYVSVVVGHVYVSRKLRKERRAAS